MSQRPQRPLRARPDPLRRESGSTRPRTRAALVQERVDWLRRPGALALAGVGLPACGWLAAVGVEQAFTCWLACSEADERVSDQGEGYVFLAFMAAFALTLSVQWLSLRSVGWSRGFLAWALLMGTALWAVFSGIDLESAHRIGLTYLPVALFLAVIVPPRDARWTVGALAGGMALFALLVPHAPLLAALVAPLPLVAAELALARER